MRLPCMAAVAAVLAAAGALNAASRKVVIPPGKWLSDDGQVVTGPAEISVAAPLSRLPHFVLTEGNIK